MAKQPRRQHTFELYILGYQITPEHWMKLNRAIVSQLGMFGGRYELLLRTTDNVVRFFVRSEKDLSSLSNAIEGLLLRPAAASDIGLPDSAGKEGLFQFVAGGNILDLKEKLQIKKSKSLVYAALDIRALSHDKMLVGCDLYFSLGKMHTKAHKTLTAFPSHLLSINFAANTHYLKKTIPHYLNIEKAVHMLSSERLGALVEVDTFPFFSHNYYLGLGNYEFDKHSFIIGASGSGKSKLISLFVDQLAKLNFAGGYRVVVLDPHASLASDFGAIHQKQIINFTGESTQLFGGSASDISAATELTATLFKSLMTGQASPKTDRVLRFSLYVLLTAQTMSLESLMRLLTEVDFRNQVLGHVRGYVPDNIVHFFGADFNEMRTKYYDEALSPIISLVDEMQMQPALVGEGEQSLERVIADNFLTVFSLNKVSMGERVVKTVAGLLIQQIFLLAQARVFRERVILIVDEVSVVQNPALAAILSEARKFNLTVILTQQYFGQIEKDLQDAIFANVYNYYTFKVSEEDARALEGNLNIELPEELVASEHAKGIKEKDLRVKVMTELHPRECLVRVVSGGQVVPAMKARTLDAPTSTTAAGSAPALKPFAQKPVSLPTKFAERPPAQTQQTAAAETPSAAPTQSGFDESNSSLVTASAKTPASLGNAAVAPISQSLPAQTFNLSELLASHSSGRMPLHKRKDR